MINSIPLVRRLVFRGSKASIPLTESTIKTLPPELRRFLENIATGEHVHGNQAAAVKLACFLSNDKVRNWWTCEGSEGVVKLACFLNNCMVCSADELAVISSGINWK